MVDVAVVGKVLAGRLQDLMVVLERHDAFVAQPDDSGRGPARISQPIPSVGAESADVARDMVLRTLSVAASPQGSTLLRALGDRDHTTAELATLLARPRLTVWEQVNDLAQVGLAARDGVDDRVGLTPAGVAVAELIEGLSVATTEALRP